MTESIPNTAIHELAEQRRVIAIIWSVEDVQEVRPDFDEDQAWEVLQKCKQCHDCEWGMTWDFIESVAGYLFPAPDPNLETTEVFHD